jgi:hypothetical protein
MHRQGYIPSGERCTFREGEGVERDAGQVEERREGICRRCGRCCYQKLLLGDIVVYTNVPCPHLDLETKLCTVYERRHEVNPDCLGVEDGLRRGVFRADCPYAEGVPGYRPPIEDPSPSLLAEILEELEPEEVAT